MYWEDLQLECWASRGPSDKITGIFSSNVVAWKWVIFWRLGKLSSDFLTRWFSYDVRSGKWKENLLDYFADSLFELPLRSKTVDLEVDMMISKMMRCFMAHQSCWSPFELTARVAAIERCVPIQNSLVSCQVVCTMGFAVHILVIFATTISWCAMVQSAGDAVMFLFMWNLYWLFLA